MTRVTIGPGAMINTIVINRKAVKSSRFMSARFRLEGLSRSAPSRTG
jgi:hypothetical protein